MKMKTISLLATGALFAVASTASAETKKIQLKSKWKPGVTLVQKMQMDMEVNMALGGESQKMTTDVLMDSTLSVGKVDAKKQKAITISYDRMAMEAAMAGNTLMKFDSTEDAGAGNPAAAMVGKKMKLIVDDKDEFVKLEDTDGVLKEAGGNPMLGQMFNEQSFKEMMNKSGLYATPDKPVGPGDSWPFKFDMELPQMGKMGLKGRYTLKKFEDVKGHKCAVIDMDAKLAMELDGGADGGDDEAASALKAMNMKIAGATMKGTLWFDNELGQARKSEIKSNMTMEMKNPESGEAMKMPIKQNILVTLEEKKAKK